MAVRRWPAIPKRVKGAVMDYTVTEGTQDFANAGEKCVTEVGAFLHITKCLPPEGRWQTFLHELIHKWEEEGGFRMKDEPNDSDVDRLAVAMFADFKRNGWKLPGE